MRLYLEGLKLWSAEQNEKERAEMRKAVIAAMQAAEKDKKPPVSDMFTDVYETLPWHLEEQRQELKELLESNPKAFPQLSQHLPWKD